MEDNNKPYILEICRTGSSYWGGIKLDNNKYKCLVTSYPPCIGFDYYFGDEKEEEYETYHFSTKEELKGFLLLLNP